jgi:rhodanese-related sulfurtransferase
VHENVFSKYPDADVSGSIVWIPMLEKDTLAAWYQKDREKILLVDTRQEWEHRNGHIAGSLNFPTEPNWWARWQRKGALKALLGPQKGQRLVFY